MCSALSGKSFRSCLRDKFIWNEITRYFHVARPSGHHATHDVQNQFENVFPTFTTSSFPDSHTQIQDQHEAKATRTIKKRRALQRGAIRLLIKIMQIDKYKKKIILFSTLCFSW